MLQDQPVAADRKPNTDTPEHKDAYRAPRLVPLGTAVGLVRGGIGLYKDDPSSPIQGRHG